MDNNNRTGLVFDIQKFSIHDGPGIRTTVFLKGCSLDCAWCHNPESKDFGVEISFLPEKCIGCGYCFRVCPEGCHVMEGDVHVFNRESCTRCGLCTTECYAQALEIVGRDMRVEEVLAEVMKDLPFYETSGGGMTVSGGEPLAQFSFTLALLEEAKRAGLHTCVETSGHGKPEHLRQFIPLVDLFLFDYKATGMETHTRLIGKGNELILSNLELLDAEGTEIHLRCPMVPNSNTDDGHLQAIAEIANRYSSIKQIDLLPYHPLGISKSEKIGKEYPLEDDRSFVDDEIADSWLQKVSGLTGT
ncbi:MAG: glycyl-radical enzyme activating protein, partial [Spirochaetales bacterium]|nr:glycyl-radical enzyme activating protein [Spirochaetales bacterium]